ncbi:MAG: hypothetical protein IJE72_05695 [Clostridia bacterium]|nr:hypothetical protein [Clostridia bacterium]
MKKTLKSILAAALAFILAFGSFSAFAENGKTLKWIFDREWEDYAEYLYSGELKEGENTLVSTPKSDFLYYTFHAAKDGYYQLGFDPYDLSWTGIPEEIENGIAYEVKSSIYYSTETSDNEAFMADIYYLKAGETVVGVDYYYEDNASNGELTIEYLGESMDIIFEEKDLNNLVTDYDIYFNDEYSFFYTDCTLSFSGGKTIFREKEELLFSYDKYSEGENTITVKLGDYSKDVTVTAYNIYHFVKDAQLSNAENYTTVTQNYNYTYNYPSISNESVKFTFTDGSTFTTVINDNYGFAILPNGREYFVSLYYGDNYDYGYALMIDVAYQMVKEYECTVESSGIIENIGALNENNNSKIFYFFDSLLWEFRDIIYAVSVGGAVEETSDAFFNFFIRLSNLTNDIFVNIMYFFKYYLV